MKYLNVKFKCLNWCFNWLASNLPSLCDSLTSFCDRTGTIIVLVTFHLANPARTLTIVITPLCLKTNSCAKTRRCYTWKVFVLFILHQSHTFMYYSLSTFDAPCLLFVTKGWTCAESEVDETMESVIISPPLGYFTFVMGIYNKCPAKLIQIASPSKYCFFLVPNTKNTWPKESWIWYSKLGLVTITKTI